MKKYNFNLMSLLLAALLVMGLCLMIAGDLEVMERNLSDAWVRVLRLIGVFMAVVALLIAGGMKVLRVLPDEEVAAICRTSGYDPLPRKHPFSPAIFGL